MPKLQLNFTTRDAQVAALKAIAEAVEKDEATLVHAGGTDQDPTVLAIFVSGVAGIELLQPDWVKWDPKEPDVVEVEGVKLRRGEIKDIERLRSYRDEPQN